MKKCEAILFDFDGTLADTMASHYQCWKNVFETIGISITEEEYYPMEGASLLDIAKKFAKKSHTFELESLVRRKKNLYINLYQKKKLHFTQECRN